MTSESRAALAALCGVVIAVVALGVPIHITPGNGSIRCADSFFAGGLRYEDSEGLAADCAGAARARVAAAVLCGLGALSVVWLSYKRGLVRVIGCSLGALAITVGAAAVVGNLVG